jgi:hypothetical protein
MKTEKKLGANVSLRKTEQEDTQRQIVAEAEFFGTTNGLIILRDTWSFLKYYRILFVYLFIYRGTFKFIQRNHGWEALI